MCSAASEPDATSRSCTCRSHWELNLGPEMDPEAYAGPSRWAKGPSPFPIKCHVYYIRCDG